MKLFILGSIISVSLVSPPGFLRLEIIEFSDFLIILFFIILIHDFIKNSTLIDFKETYTQLWGSLVLVLLVSLSIYGISAFILRLIFYSVVGYLFTSYLKSKSTYELQYFLIPFAAVTLLNLLTSIFQLSFVENTTGWISYYYENPDFFNRGRLSGYQGSGPNVAGGMFAILTFLTLYIYIELKNKYFLILSLLNVYLIFVTYSRGAYLSLFVGIFIFIFIYNKNFKSIFISFLVAISGLLGFLYFGDSKIFLKESDRGFLTQIAFENMSIFKGLGPGNYVEGIYKDYFLSINPDILEENLNINLNKVELGITPIEHRDSEVEFFIGTSGGGYEILVQSKLIAECSEDRLTCQHVRVKQTLLADFFSAVYQVTNSEILESMNDSNCFDNNNLNILRGEFYCFVDYFYNKSNFIENKENVPQGLLFVPCTDFVGYGCESRELAHGELAVIVEQISIGNNYVTLENYKKYCSECNFRNVEGYIKFKFEKQDGILPRSKVTFYTSDDLDNWDMIGYPRTTGNIINLNKNTSFLEIGGHSDGQSFGNTFLDATVKELYIITQNKNEKITFDEKFLNEEYFVYKPNELDSYNAKITYESGGLKLFSPNKYWLAVPNSFDFSESFEIILNLSLPEIPWERQTLISSTSIKDSQVQSWKLEIDDGRLFFYWANPDGVFLDSNYIGDKSLRSGVLIQKNGKISNTSPPIVDPSFLSQLTTAHNGYMTFSVEFGIFMTILFYLVFFIFIVKQFTLANSNSAFTFLAMMMFFVLNLTNDMIYSPDMFVLLIISIGINYQSIRPLEDINSKKF